MAVISTVAVVQGIAQEAPEIGSVISEAEDEVSAWLTSAGISPSTAADATSSAVNAGP